MAQLECDEVGFYEEFESLDACLDAMIEQTEFIADYFYDRGPTCGDAMLDYYACRHETLRAYCMPFLVDQNCDDLGYDASLACL